MTKRVFSGELDFLNLSEVLQTLGNNCSTGRLVIYNQYVKSPGIIYFSNGEIIDAGCMEKKGDEAVLALFGWVDGSFEFLKEPVEMQRRIAKGRMELIMEGLNRLDEGKVEIIDPVSEVRSGTKGQNTVPQVNGPIVDLFHVVQFEKFTTHENILVEGRFGSWGWVILDGTVEIRKQKSSGDIPLLRLGPGSFLGLSTFLTDTVLRDTTDIALEKVELGVLNQEALMREFTSLSDEMRGIIGTGVTRYTRLVEILAACRSGNNPLPPREKGTALVSQGAPDDTLHEILTGGGRLIKKTPGGDTAIMDLVPGDFVGRLPFGKCLLEPESASVIVDDDASYRTVDSSLVGLEYGQLSQTLKNILDNLSVTVSVLSECICNHIRMEK